MFKNKFPISSLISIAVISISVFFILIATSMYQDDYNHKMRHLFMLIGLASFGTGTALVAKKKWARTILTISLALLSLTLLYLFIFNPEGEPKILSQIGLFILVTGLPLFFILLLYNEKVSIEFGDRHIDKETEDILDHFE